MALGAFRRNQSAATFFRGFCCGLFRGPFAFAFLVFLSSEVFDDPDGSCDSGCCVMAVKVRAAVMVTMAATLLEIAESFVS